MFKGFSLSAKLYLGFATVLAIAGGLGIFAWVQLVGIRQDSKNITGDSMPGVIYAMGLQHLVQDNIAFVLKHIVSLESKEMAAIEAAMAENRKEIEKVLEAYKATIFDPREKQLFEAIGPAREKFISVRDQEVMPPSRLSKQNEAMAAFNGHLVPAFQAYLDAAEKCVNFNKANCDRYGANIMSSVGRAITGIIVGILLAMAIGASIGIFLSRSISTALNQVITALSSGSEQVSSASNQVSASSQSMAEGASQQASSLEETSASLEEMSSMTKQNSENARQANGMASETRDAVEKSRAAMTRMGDAISRIKGSSDQTAKIIKTIDEIAFQTNLLALNAAVEAARAGDAGKGFAVVAEEVRNLAQRSAEAAKSTAALIEESQQNANNGVAVSGEVAGILTGIVESVRKLTQLIGEVSAASEEQSKGIEQIGTAVTEMDKLTQSNAANAEESASASEELAAQAKELGDMVRILVGIVKGAGSQEVYSSASAGSNSLPRAARPVAVSKDHARSGGKPAGKPQGDWSASPGKTHGNGNGHANGHARKAALAGSRTVGPEQVIPMGDSDLKDF